MGAGPADSGRRACEPTVASRLNRSASMLAAVAEYGDTWRRGSPHMSSHEFLTAGSLGVGKINSSTSVCKCWRKVAL
jgi:hypothetical protein